MILPPDPLLALLAEHPARRCCIAYSGGADSHTLLHLAAAHRHLLPSLEAVHVDHRLQPASRDWARHCEAVCRELGVAFRLLSVAARPDPGESPEAAARRARYTAFRQLLTADEALLTAHHRDDQAETLLLMLLRGSGPRGLAAMPAAAPLGRGMLLRPLLDFDRAQILAYAREQGLAWVEDPSNDLTDFDRNYLRHRVMPLLGQRWPAAARSLARSARHCGEAAGLLEELAAADLERAQGEGPATLSVPALLSLNEPRRRNLLRHWLSESGLPPADSGRLERILTEVVPTPRDARPRVSWPGGEVRRYRDRLYALTPLNKPDPTLELEWPPDQAMLAVPGAGRLTLQRVTGDGLAVERVEAGRLMLRLRRGGERFRPRGRRHSQELKKLLQEGGIPPWERDRLPLLYLDGHLAWVPGLGVAAEPAAGPGQAGLLPHWSGPENRSSRTAGDAKRPPIW